MQLLVLELSPMHTFALRTTMLQHIEAECFSLNGWTTGHGDVLSL